MNRSRTFSAPHLHVLARARPDAGEEPHDRVAAARRWLGAHLTVRRRGEDRECWSGVMKELGWAIALTSVGWIVARSIALMVI